MIQKHIVVAPEFAQRDFCSFVYSNTNADPIRGKLFEALSNYKKVNSGGKYLNNLPEGKSVEDKFIFESGHKFSIACENASHPGYHTEKLAEAFAAGTIPIYWGDPEITKVFNEKAFINCNHYTSMEAVIERVIYLDEHPDEYIAMLREPALLQECGLDFPERKLAELEAYLVHIFSQEKEQAYRRNRGFWGRQYQQKVLSTESVIKKYNKLRNLLPIKWLRKLKENI